MRNWTFELRHSFVILVLTFVIATAGSFAVAQDSFTVNISIDAKQSKGPLRQIYRFFGADEPNYAYMPHGSKLLGELGKLGPSQAYFRAHNMLCTGDGTPALKWGSTNAYTEDAQGNPVYDWTITDRIFDAYLKNNVKPYAQIGFMPKALSTNPEPYQHSWTPRARYEEIYTGWAYPPRDYDKWRELVFQWVKHCVEEYGAEEVNTWYWETWNEANIRNGYWRGTPEEFRKLHDYAIDGVKRALPTARVGGPDSAGAGGQWMRDFLNHCLRGTNHANGKVGTPIDFIAFHAKGSPRRIGGNRDNPEAGYVQMGIANQLREIDRGFGIVASFPELKNTPIIIGESDPEGCAACQGPQLAYRNGTLYSSYTAASFARKHDLADKHGINFEGALTWAFEFEGHPYFAGFRSLATNGIDKPVLNVFRMFGKMSGQRLNVESTSSVDLETMVRVGVREKPDVHGFASLDERKLCVMVWHYHDDNLPGADAKVALSLKNLPAAGPMQLTHYRIDNDHSNSFELWKKMGSPQQPTDEQYAQLEKAGRLHELEPSKQVQPTDGAATVELTLPRQGVSMLVFTW
jgi:xylan 1,4-beta-xylosidase